MVTNAVVCWHTEYMGLAVDQLRGAGREVDAEVLAHISPARSSAVNYYGSITSTTSTNSPSSTTGGTAPCGPWTPTSQAPDCKAAARDRNLQTE